jgi:hypothetical protein
MAKSKQLRDLYRFPGFLPEDRIKGVFGDPLAVVVTLRRNRKKRSAPPAAKRTGHGTTSGPGVCEISPAATNASIYFSPCAVFNVCGAGA